MRNWVISKEVDFCYAHRVHSQQLLHEFVTDSCLACRHLHGHQGKITVLLEGSELNEQGMVTDFKHLGWFKKFVDDNIDHKLILDINDPYTAEFLKPLSTGLFQHKLKLDAVEFEGYKTHEVVAPFLYINSETHIKEVFEGLILVDFVPTSENLAKWLFDIVNHKMGSICKVHSVTFNETPKTCARFYGE